MCSSDLLRLVRTRRSLVELRAELADLRRPRYALARRALRRRADEISRRYRTYGKVLRVESAAELATRSGQREAQVAVEREIQRVDDWLATIHARVYTKAFASLGKGDPAVDFGEERLHPILAETLAPGYEYLDRAHSAYRHALEAVSADPRLLDRVTELTAALETVPRAGAAPPLAGARAEPPRGTPPELRPFRLR